MAAPAMNKESMSRGMLSLTDDRPLMSIWLNAPPTTMYSANTCGQHEERSVRFCTRRSKSAGCMPSPMGC